MKKLLSIVLIVGFVSNVFAMKLKVSQKFLIKTSYIVPIIAVVAMASSFIYNYLMEKEETKYLEMEEMEEEKTKYLNKYLSEKIFFAKDGFARILKQERAV